MPFLALPRVRSPPQARKPLHLHYIVGMSATRVMLPLYLFGYNSNFVAVAFPAFKPDPELCVALVVWVTAQVRSSEKRSDEGCDISK